jgi:hypothetical protein
LIDVGGLASPQITNVETAENLSLESKYSSSCIYFVSRRICQIITSHSASVNGKDKPQRLLRIFLLISVAASAQTGGKINLPPLYIKEQGSFAIGGTVSSIHPERGRLEPSF